MRKALGKKGMIERIFAHVQVQKYTSASDPTSVSKLYHQIGMNTSFFFPPPALPHHRERPTVSGWL